MKNIPKHRVVTVGQGYKGENHSTEDTAAFRNIEKHRREFGARHV